MKKSIWFVGLLGLCVVACSDNDGAREVLRKAGYTDIKTDGYAFWGCSDSDTYSTKFKAKGPTGVEVSGVVCSGAFFKSNTIRID
jgi:hypothetical protein